MNRNVVILGGGPAGLTAALELSRHQIPSVVLEQDELVGGLARTVSYKGYLFDIGGHRFFTKVDEINRIWHEVLGDDFLERERLSRIYYRGKFFHYPLKPMNALAGLGPVEAVRILLSYLRSQAFPERPEDSFEQWVSNRFGKRLYSIFFKTYTEKVWGVPCTELRAEWAAQRIKDLSLATAVLSILFKRSGGKTIRTLIEKFHYPRQGPGMMWTRLTEQLEKQGHPVRRNTEVVAVRHDGGAIRSVVARDAGSGKEREFAGTDFISSIAMGGLLRRFDPAPPPEIREAAASLKYRDFLTVGLIYRGEHLFPDNWIYVHSADVKVGRIQNYKNWSPEMVPDPSTTGLGLEYFCNKGDELWNAADGDLIRQGVAETERLGLASSRDFVDGVVIRVPKAYPIYDATYAGHLEKLKRYLAGFGNLQLVGRNGMHKYNNQDHSMLTALLAVRNLLGANYDLWQVNTEQEYHEEVREKEPAAAPSDAAHLTHGVSQ